MQNYLYPAFPIFWLDVNFGSSCVSQVNWLQCDKCGLWFHLTCIGLKPHMVKEDFCFFCR